MNKCKNLQMKNNAKKMGLNGDCQTRKIMKVCRKSFYTSIIIYINRLQAFKKNNIFGGFFIWNLQKKIQIT
jgi:hypothetical protein